MYQRKKFRHKSKSNIWIQKLVLQGNLLGIKIRETTAQVRSVPSNKIYAETLA